METEIPQINIIQKNTFEVIKSAVDKTVNLIKPTFGPAANKVIISKVLNKMVVDDGVQIARDLELPDPNENAVLHVIRETAIATNDRVGDGTTCSLIMLQAIMEAVGRKTKFEGAHVARELEKGLIDVKAQLKKMAKTIKTKDDLTKVARISFDNEKIAGILADTWFKMGKEGSVSLALSGTMETYPEVENGIKINRGYVSPYMITDGRKMEASVEKPYILVTDYRLTEINDVLPIMNELVKKQINTLVIICDNIEQNALATAIVNKMQGKFLLVAVQKPVGEATLEDIALMCGAKMFSMNKQDRLENAKIEDLGTADRFIAKKSESFIIGPKSKKTELEDGKKTTEIKKAIDELKTAILIAKTERDREELERRYAFLTNKVAVIKVGAPTENELNNLKYKVDDAINAVKSAFIGGVVCGGGLALSRLETSSELLNQALKAPLAQILDNMRVEKLPALKEDEAINLVTGKVGNYLEVGVMDPVDVLIAAVESAVSIASVLVTTSGMIIEPPKKMNQ